MKQGEHNIVINIINPLMHNDEKWSDISCGVHMISFYDDLLVQL